MTNTIECRVLLYPESDALRFLPEGPYSLPNGNLSWVAIQHGGDSNVGSINVLDPTSGTNQTFELPGRPGFAFPTTTDGIFICGVERSLGTFNTANGEWIEVCGNIDDAVENTIINDGVIYEDCLIFGCKHLDFNSKRAGLYLWRQSDRQLIQLRDDQICSNGKAVVKGTDGQLSLIDIDSPTKIITRSSLDVQAGAVGEQQTIVDLTAEEVFPDGLVVTPDGKSLIVALYDPGDPRHGAARQYGIESGEPEAVWTCPGSPRVTCPQLVNVDGKVQLLLTTAVEHMETTQQANHPNAGCLFIGETNFSTIADQPLFPSA